MIDTPHVAGVAHMIGDPSRAAMLTALKHDRSLPATALARVAGVAPNTASGHLAMLVQSGLVICSSKGRHRYYQLSRPEVADTLEAIESLAARTVPADRLRPPRDRSLKYARLCFDHLAGTLGVAITASLVSEGFLKTGRQDYAVTKKGEQWFAELGIELDDLRNSPRRLARRCPDWSERHPHLGGAAGAALLDRLVALDWLRPQKRSRAVRLTTRGREGLQKLLEMRT